MPPSSEDRSPANLRSASAPRGRLKSRASHTKSRKGCATCKQRRVKCDEARPICGACKLRGDRCEFPQTENVSRRQPPRRNTPVAEREESVPSNVSIHQPLPDAGTIWTSRSRYVSESIPLRPLEFGGTAASPIHGPEGLNMTDLRLLQYYILRLSPRLSLNPMKCHVWTKVIPELAAANEFLMHLVLALAGLDLFAGGSASIKEQCSHPNWPGLSQQPSSDPLPTSHSLTQGQNGAPSEPKNVADLQAVIEHHQRGLQGFREQLTVLSVSNAEAMFAGSLLLVAFAFGSLRVRSLTSGEPDVNEPLESPDPNKPWKPEVDWIYLVRGVSSIVQQHWDYLRMSRLRPMFFYDNSRDAWKKIPSDFMHKPMSTRSYISERLIQFEKGAHKALYGVKEYYLNLRAQFPQTPLTESNSDPYLDPTPEHILSAQFKAIEILEEYYARILYVLQFSTSGLSRPERLDVQADIEDALVMAWPQFIPHLFVRSIEIKQDPPSLMQGLSYAILAYFYVMITLLTDVWYGEGNFELDIERINETIETINDIGLNSLMEWPMRVIDS